MLWRNARDVAMFARRIENSKCTLQTKCHVSKRSSKDGKLKMIRKEDKMLFGKLVETKKEKLKRLKLESKGKIRKAVVSNIDSELSFMLENSKLVVVNIVKDQVNSSSNCDTEKIPKIEKTTEDKSILKLDVTNKEILNVEPEVKKQKDPLLPRVVVQHLLEFPVFDKNKSSNEERLDNSTILSISPMENKSCLKYPSVTKILSATMSEEAKAILEKWKIRMIEQLGLRGFELYQAELLGDGRLLHSTIMKRLTEKSYEVPNKIKQAFLSITSTIQDIDRVEAIESHVIHPRLMYRGIVDCVASYRGDLCLIDWKKSDKVKSTVGSTYDAPLQLASYIGALNADLKYPYQIKKGIIVVAYTNGKPATVHEISGDSLQLYWKLWLQRLQDYHVSLNPC